MKAKFSHNPVMLKEVLETFKYLKNKESTIFVDGTLGLGGHSSEMVNKYNNINIIGIDKDKEALRIAQSKLGSSDRHTKGNNKFDFVHDDFSNIPNILEDLNVRKVDGILLDLGVSSMQLDDKSRGFSFEDPNQVLDMRMNKSQHKDAEYILNNYSKRDLERVLKDGEERFYKKITKLVIEARKVNRIKTVGELLEIVSKAFPPKLKAKKTNFATDTFRALRLEVNDEISKLGKSIEDMVETLRPGGKLAIITFHSLEDRVVKHKFRQLENPCTCPPKQPYCTCGNKPQIKILTKKPTIPCEDEIADNPRSRSAKLRVAEKI